MINKIRSLVDDLRHNKAFMLVATATVLGGLLRYYSSLDDLWLDEIWSVNFARSMGSIWDVFQTSYDNNHVLNTVYLYYFGEGMWWPGYRLLSIISGTASVAIIGYIGSRRGLYEGAAAAFLAALSFPLITYSAEARGYAPAILFALIAYVAFDAYHKKWGTISMLTFWASSALAVLAHLTFVYVFFAFFISSLAGLIFYGTGSLKKMVLLYAAPVYFMLLLYISFVKSIVFGGGEYVNIGTDRLSLFLSPVLGIWSPLPFGFLPAIISSLAFIVIVIWIFREEFKDRLSGIFLAVVLAVIPLLSFIAPVDFFGPRYLALSLPFLYIILASILIRTSGRMRYGIMMSLSTALLLGSGNLAMIHDQIRLGRGDYLNTVKYIIGNSEGDVIRLMTDHDFRNKTVIDFYAESLLENKKIRYINLDILTAKKSENPDWLVMHNFDPEFKAPEAGYMGDETYELAKISKHANILSGWSWFIYKKK